MVVCLYVLVLRQAGNVSRVYPAFCPMVARIGSSPETPLVTLFWISGRNVQKTNIQHEKIHCANWLKLNRTENKNSNVITKKNARL